MVMLMEKTNDIVVDILVMRKSEGADYYVQITCGDRSTTPHVFTNRYEAEYHVDHYKWIFGQRDDDVNLMSYDENSHPNLY